MYGVLKTERIPSGVPPIQMPAWLAALAQLRTPAQLHREMKASATASTSFNTVLTYNLHYELSGFGCQTAAVPRADGEGYKFCRRLEWDCGFEPKFKFAPLHDVEEPARIRYTPGLVGALSGHMKNQWAVAMNYSPDYSEAGINYTGEPVAWILREMLASGYDYDDIKSWLLEKLSVKQAFVTLVSPYKACWIVLDPKQSWAHKEVEFPKVLSVGNGWKEIPFNKHEWQGLNEEPYQADVGEWVLDKYQHNI